MSRSRVLPDPCGPITPAVRSHGTHSSPPRGSCAGPSRHPTSSGRNAPHVALPLGRVPYRSGRTTGAVRSADRLGPSSASACGPGGHPFQPSRPPPVQGRLGRSDARDRPRSTSVTAMHVHSSVGAGGGGARRWQAGAGVAAEQAGQALEQVRATAAIHPVPASRLARRCGPPCSGQNEQRARRPGPPPSGDLPGEAGRGWCVGHCCIGGPPRPWVVYPDPPVGGAARAVGDVRRPARSRRGDVCRWRLGEVADVRCRPASMVVLVAGSKTIMTWPTGWGRR